jgi:hypothetical protein
LIKITGYELVGTINIKLAYLNFPPFVDFLARRVSVGIFLVPRRYYCIVVPRIAPQHFALYDKRNEPLSLQT